MEKALNDWPNRILWGISVLMSCGVMLGGFWNFSVKPSLGTEFMTIRENDKQAARLEKTFERLESEDTKLSVQLENISIKIDDIYKLLINSK